MFSVLCNLEINFYMSNGTAQIYCLLNSYCFKLFWWPLFVFLVGKYCIELLTLFLMLQRVLSNSKSDVHFEFMKLWVWLQSTSNDFFEHLDICRFPFYLFLTREAGNGKSFLNLFYLSFFGNGYLDEGLCSYDAFMIIFRLICLFFRTT